MEDQQTTTLSPEFKGRAAPPPRVPVKVDLDADIVEWLDGQPLSRRAEINNALRFMMEMCNQPLPPIEAYEDEHFAEPEAGPDMRQADRIAHDFVPG
jgi:hypothetical protein